MRRAGLIDHAPQRETNGVKERPIRSGVVSSQTRAMREASGSNSRAARPAPSRDSVFAKPGTQYVAGPALRDLRASAQPCSRRLVWTSLERLTRCWRDACFAMTTQARGARGAEASTFCKLRLAIAGIAPLYQYGARRESEPPAWLWQSRCLLHAARGARGSSGPRVWSEAQRTLANRATEKHARQPGRAPAFGKKRVSGFHAHCGSRPRVIALSRG